MALYLLEISTVCRNLWFTSKRSHKLLVARKISLCDTSTSETELIFYFIFQT